MNRLQFRQFRSTQSARAVPLAAAYIPPRFRERICNARARFAKGLREARFLRRALPVLLHRSAPMPRVAHWRAACTSTRLKEEEMTMRIARELMTENPVSVSA